MLSESEKGKWGGSVGESGEMGGEEGFDLLDNGPVLGDDVLGSELEDAGRGGDADEGLDAVGFGLFGSVAVVEVELVGAGEPDDGGGAEGGAGDAIGGGEGAGEGHHVEPLEVHGVVGKEGRAVGVFGGGGGNGMVEGLRKALEMAFAPGEEEGAVVVGCGLPEDGVGPREWLCVEKELKALLERRGGGGTGGDSYLFHASRLSFKVN